jgi:hypothetical protein
MSQNCQVASFITLSSYDTKTEMTFGGIARVRYNKMIYQSGYLSYSPLGI